MDRIDRHSDSFLRYMALHHLKTQKRKMSFQARLADPTIEALRERGCVVGIPDDGVHTVTSPIPFGKLVTAAEWRQDRLELLHGIGLLVFFKGGGVAVGTTALYRGLGMITAVIWFFGWLALSGCLMPKVPKSERFLGVGLASALFVLGWGVHKLGWSGLSSL